ncbi:unnamed protein product, partial [Gulo gulo]
CGVWIRSWDSASLCPLPGRLARGQSRELNIWTLSTASVHLSLSIHPRTFVRAVPGVSPSTSISH